MNPTNRSFGLDLARAVAIALVLVAHFAKVIEVAGYYGVELFFALSGFLIGGILYRDLFSSLDWTFENVSRFWQRRWWRTLPNYYLFFALTALFHFFYGGLPAPADLPRYAVFLQNLREGNHFFYGVSWSLCIEEWFYLLFPGLLWMVIGQGMKKRPAFLALTLLFLIAPALIRERLFLSFKPEDVRVMTLARLDAIFYGVAVAFLHQRYRLPASLTRWPAIVGAGLVAAVALSHAYRVDAPTAAFRVAFILVPCGFALTMPWLEALAQPAKSFALLQIGIEKLSLWSYSIYLCHIPILFTVYAAFGGVRESALVNLASKATALALSVAAAACVYRWFELPMLSFRPRQMQPALAES
jgi:peptidoglycan/LPS O-acetylase OafA/YrhL